MTLTFEGQAFCSVLEAFLTHYPFGDFICFPAFSLVSSISAVVKRSVAIWSASSLWKNVRHDFQSLFSMRINSDPDTATACGFHLMIFLYKQQYQIRLKHDLPWGWWAADAWQHWSCSAPTSFLTVRTLLILYKTLQNTEYYEHVVLLPNTVLAVRST